MRRGFCSGQEVPVLSVFQRVFEGSIRLPSILALTMTSATILPPVYGVNSGPAQIPSTSWLTT
jgi:hypothetical protein